VNGAIQASLLQRPAEDGAVAPRPQERGTRSLRARLGALVSNNERAQPRGPGPSRGGGRPRGAGPRGPWSGLALLPWVILGAAAVVAAALAGISATVAFCLAALALACMVLGFHLGDRGRTALEDEVDGRTSELKRALSELEIAQAETVRRLSMAVEFRDEDTGAHIERIGRFSTLLAEHIGMDPEFCERLGHSAPLHDVGKVAIPDAILLKPGPLTPEERAIVETHAEEGHRLVRGSSSSILDMAATIALSHQEKWDGSGYPRGLKGEAIPIEGRIVAVADVFDALTSDRVYRKAFSVEDAVQMMREQRARHFDPVLLDAFMEVLGQTGPDAREQMRSDPAALVESTLETFASALERGDAEIAEGAIATAIEDGITPTTLHAEVIGPALRRISVLSGAGEIDGDREHRAATITRRVLATLYRYMTVGTEATRERVLLAGFQGDEHTLGLQMVHDQLAAAGFQTIFDTDLTTQQLLGMVDSQAPDLVVVGATEPGSAEAVELALRDLRASHPELPIVLSGPAVGGNLPRERRSMRVLERIDETVPAVEDVLSTAASTASV
jgi:HD-GYP domain-containing protein (c-di-GMP phosphodiesterase class II)/methylmalonyl-CoA mutase cobalamin-binding subunit